MTTTNAIFSDFFNHLEHAGLGHHKAHFDQVFSEQFSTKRHPELAEWLEILASQPAINASTSNLATGVELGTANDLAPEQLQKLDGDLRSLIPWRKGPFKLFDININTEWRSDWKWNRVSPHLSSLKNRRVLDVGCGSGYHCWRMLGEGASWVLGIDPSPRFIVQFELIKHYMQLASGVNNVNADVIPAGIEHIPARLNYFDTTFSMGVLYHRSSPIDHLKELRDTLKPGGELILETLVIDGKLGEVLVPDDRYAQMRNVWFIPSIPSLVQWLHRCGFEDAHCVDLNQTSVEEQRSTEWMPSHSLKEFLSAEDQNRTIEGYPAPLRSVIVARRKGGKK